MTKSEFESLYNEISTKVYNESLENLIKTIREEKAQNNKINKDDILVISHVELMNFTSALVKDVLLRALPFD